MLNAIGPIGFWIAVYLVVCLWCWSIVCGGGARPMDQPSWKLGAVGPWSSEQARLYALMLWLMWTVAFLVGLMHLLARR